MSRKTAVAPFLIMVVLIAGAYAAVAEPCDPASCFTPPPQAVVQPITSPAEFPVVVDGPPAAREGKFGVLHAADGPTPYSWAALFAGVSTVLVTLFVLIRNRRAFLDNEVEPEPGELFEPTEPSRAQELVV